MVIGCYVHNTRNIQYEINWFQKNLSNTIIEHGRSVYYKTKYDEKVRFGQYWEGQDFRNDMLGDYWCQVKLTDRQPPEYLSKSNILTVREPDYYNNSLPTCDDKQYVLEKECIGNDSLISSYSRTLSVSLMTSQIQSPILPTSTTTASRSKHLLSSPAPTVTTENKNGINIFLIGIVILGIVLVLVVFIFFIIILSIIITFKRKKMILLGKPIGILMTDSHSPLSLSVVLNQRNDETKCQENKNNTIIKTKEQDGSLYPSQNPRYQPLTVTNTDYVSIYDNRNEGNIPTVRINEVSGKFPIN